MMLLVVQVEAIEKTKKMELEMVAFLVSAIVGEQMEDVSLY